MPGYNGTQGRRPKPTALKLLQGNPGRRPIASNEPVPPEGEVKCPQWVRGRARVFWRRYEPILTAMNVLSVADVPTLALLCETEAEFWEARDQVRAGGGVAYNRIASDAGKRLKSLLVEFGMSPSSRTRVHASPRPEKKSALQELRERQKT